MHEEKTRAYRDMKDFSGAAKTVCTYLADTIAPAKQVITYAELSRATGVPRGPKEENPLLQALEDVFEYCDFHKLPPLPSVAVLDGGIYDAKKRHGMVSGEYLVWEANSLNNAGRVRKSGSCDWRKKPRPRDTEAWKYKDMIEAHQDSVWEWAGEWKKWVQNTAKESL